MQGPPPVQDKGVKCNVLLFANHSMGKCMCWCLRMGWVHVIQICVDLAEEAGNISQVLLLLQYAE